MCLLVARVSWILTLFTDGRVLSYQTTVCFLDLFVETGWKAFFRVCLAIFRTIEISLLRRQSTSEIILFLAEIKRFLIHKVSERTMVAIVVSLRSKGNSNIIRAIWTEPDSSRTRSPSRYVE